MAKGFKGGFGGGNMMRQQQQMQQKIMKMQQDVKEAQEAVEAQAFTASVGGGAVSATVNGKKEMTDIVIKPEKMCIRDRRNTAYQFASNRTRVQVSPAAPCRSKPCNSCSDSFIRQNVLTPLCRIWFLQAAL